jgi:hypothetical protein
VPIGDLVMWHDGDVERLFGQRVAEWPYDQLADIAIWCQCQLARVGGMRVCKRRIKRTQMDKKSFASFPRKRRVFFLERKKQGTF